MTIYLNRNKNVKISSENSIKQWRFIVVIITKYFLNRKMHLKRYTNKNEMHLKRFKPGCNIYGDPNEKG